MDPGKKNPRKNCPRENWSPEKWSSEKWSPENWSPKKWSRKIQKQKIVGWATTIPGDHFSEDLFFQGPFFGDHFSADHSKQIHFLYCSIFVYITKLEETEKILGFYEERWAMRQGKKWLKKKKRKRTKKEGVVAQAWQDRVGSLGRYCNYTEIDSLMGCEGTVCKEATRPAPCIQFLRLKPRPP